ncbi:MAG: hypothetical protein JRN15_19545, partial [Nitrososphaerota archaeon]|nr:hypothetical protein [Nitrososphaerota archaeon]
MKNIRRDGRRSFLSKNGIMDKQDEGACPRSTMLNDSSQNKCQFSFLAKWHLLDIAIIFAVGIIEYFLIEPSALMAPFYSLPLKYAYPISSYNNVFNINGTMSLYFFIIFLFYGIHAPVSTYYMTYHFILVLATFASMAWSIRYFLIKYGGMRNMNMLTTFFSISVSIPYIWNFQFEGGYSYPYLFLTPLLLAVLDFSFDDLVFSSGAKFLRRAILLAAIASLCIMDPRTFVYTLTIITFFTIYSIIREQYSLRTKSRLNSGFKMIVFYCLFLGMFTVFNIRTLLAYFEIRSFGIHILSNAAASQLGIAYQNFPVLLTVTGFANWSSSYSPFNGSIFLGLIPFLFGCISLFDFRFRRISPFIFFLIAGIVILTSLGTPTSVFYSIGQTRYFPYLVYVYPTYLISILLMPLLYLFCSLGISSISHLASSLVIGYRSDNPTTSRAVREVKHSISKESEYSDETTRFIFHGLSYSKSFALLSVALILSQGILYLPILKDLQQYQVVGPNPNASVQSLLDFMATQNSTGITYLVTQG